MDITAQLTKAIDLALQGQWDAAHQIVQNLDGDMAAWIHAVLHKIEGDLGNSQYWYRRAQRPYSQCDPTSELTTIRQSMAGTGAG